MQFAQNRWSDSVKIVILTLYFALNWEVSLSAYRGQHICSIGCSRHLSTKLGTKYQKYYTKTVSYMTAYKLAVMVPLPQAKLNQKLEVKFRNRCECGTNHSFPFNLKLFFYFRTDVTVTDIFYRCLGYMSQIVLWASVIRADIPHMVFCITVTLLRSHWRGLWSLCPRAGTYRNTGVNKGRLMRHLPLAFVSCTWTRCKNYTSSSDH